MRHPKSSSKWRSAVERHLLDIKGEGLHAIFRMRAFITTREQDCNCDKGLVSCFSLFSVDQNVIRSSGGGAEPLRFEVMRSRLVCAFVSSCDGVAANALFPYDATSSPPAALRISLARDTSSELSQ